MRRTKEEAEKTRQDLLDAALTIFSQKGYEATRLEDIAQAAGVTRGAIYHHFGSKADLFIALVEDASQLGNTTIEQALAKGGSFIDITTRILVSTLSLLESNRRFREVMALSLFMTGASPELENLQKKRYQEAQTLVEEIRGFFQAGIQQGELRPDLDPQIVARAFLAYQNGLALLWISNQDAFSIRESAPGLADLFLRGIVVE